MLRPTCITGTGSFVPSRVLTNAELEKMVDTNDQWIVERTGIQERRIAGAEETTSTMGAEAARRALADAGVSAEEVDLILVATITPDMVFPNTACRIQTQIGATRAFCMDLEAACSGFLYALETATQYVATGRVDTVLVIGAEKLSTITDWTDRGTCILFGDAAGAVVVQSKPDGSGILASSHHSDGRLGDLLKLPGGGSLHPTSEETLRQGLHTMKMDGREVFKHAVTCMISAAREALAVCGLGIEDIKLVIPHQANMRIVKAIGDRLGGTPEQYFVNLHKYGNTSAASVVVALDEASREGRLAKGDLVLLVAFGGGFVWGASILEWWKS
ncbi:MAG TPA: beta-ketoacyl-ACP synthase III [Kiritimatiellia bacterium]|nr:beta-ketoacyl-ACP synthase III [Kiritimatiellia bacterium]